MSHAFIITPSTFSISSNSQGFATNDVYTLQQNL